MQSMKLYTCFSTAHFCSTLIKLIVLCLNKILKVKNYICGPKRGELHRGSHFNKSPISNLKENLLNILGADQLLVHSTQADNFSEDFYVIL
jgi:hypothetical protein